MATSGRDRVFFEVPLSNESLEELHAIAEQEGKTPMRILREVVESYQRNGRPVLPVQSDDSREYVYRGVPVTHALVRDVNEMAAQFKVSPLVLLRGIVEDGLRKRVAALSVTA